MTKANAANERIKRQYFAYLKEAKGRDDATIDGVAKALARFEDSTGRREFKRFHREQAMAFKKALALAVNARTGERIRKATMLSTLRELRAFFFWLAHLPGFKSHIAYCDADYFNLSEKDISVARAKREKSVPTLAQVHHVLSAMPSATVALRMFTADEQREIVFRDIHTGDESHRTMLDAGAVADWRNVVGWFAKSIKDDLRLVGGYDVLFGKLKHFIEDGLFATRVDLDDPNVLRNLSEVAVTRALFDTVKGAINRLTIHDSGSTHVVEHIKLSETRPQVVRRRETIEATKSLMNKVAGDNPFELDFARFLEAAPDVQAFYKNSEATNFMVEYQSAGGGIVRDYRPDFVVRDTGGTIWIVETKGREDLEDPRKWERLKLWCVDATAQDSPNRYRALFVRQEAWDALLNPVRTLSAAEAVFGER